MRFCQLLNLFCFLGLSVAFSGSARRALLKPPFSAALSSFTGDVVGTDGHFGSITPQRSLNPAQAGVKAPTLWCDGRVGCCVVSSHGARDAGCDALGAGWRPAPSAAVWECPPISDDRFGIYGPEQR